MRSLAGRALSHIYKVDKLSMGEGVNLIREFLKILMQLVKAMKMFGIFHFSTLETITKVLKHFLD